MAGVLFWARSSSENAREAVRRGLRKPGNRRLKAVTDWALAAVCLALVAPLMLAIAWRVRRDGGPALFIQPREGRDGRAIRVFKFRSMHVRNCDTDARSSVAWRGPGVTDFGRFLRRSGLDELPQLFNVLNGTMSLIGPRPHVFDMEVNGQRYVDLVPQYNDRQLVRPGITGLAQVRGRCGPVTDIAHAEARVADDREYIDNWSLWLDLQIIVATAQVILRQLAVKRD